MAHQSPPSPTRALPQPVDMTIRIHRRIVPEPLEMVSRSNRGSPYKPQEHNAETGVRRVLPQPIETCQISSKNANYIINPSHDSAAASMAMRSTPLTSSPPMESNIISHKPRKFAPQLVETSRRRRRSTDSVPAVLQSDKTEESPGDHLSFHRPRILVRPSAFPIVPDNSPVVSTEQVPPTSESSFSSLHLGKNEPRRHSFRVPSLPSIQQSTGDSEGSNESDCPSLSTSPSAASDETEHSKHAKWVGKGRPKTSTGYLLSLAAQSAEKQLREQAMAAYPNENMHEPVDHFAVDRETDDIEVEDETEYSSRNTPKAIKEESHTQRSNSAAGRDMAESRRHQETLEKVPTQHKTTVQPELDRRRSVKSSFRDPEKQVRNLQQSGGTTKHYHGEGQKDVEMENMRNAASPPMGGQNLRFPHCQSPQQTRLDVGQHPSTFKNLRAPSLREHTGLWTPACCASKAGSVSGLWMGTSAKPPQGALEPPANFQTGLITPISEQDDPFTSSSASYQRHQLPPSPPSSHSDSKISCLDAILSEEQKFALEFHDAFVTQVYNYLSLGYPALARKYDVELGKISKVSVEELRQDDGNTNAKGYIGAPEGGSSDIRGTPDGSCARWSALKKYVKEWARQQSHMGIRPEDWGDRARRGSWAF